MTYKTSTGAAMGVRADANRRTEAYLLSRFQSPGPCHPPVGMACTQPDKTNRSDIDVETQLWMGRSGLPLIALQPQPQEPVAATVPFKQVRFSSEAFGFGLDDNFMSSTRRQKSCNSEKRIDRFEYPLLTAQRIPIPWGMHIGENTRLVAKYH
eukprot:265988-Prorocentrum_minimum.AAC.13